MKNKLCVFAGTFDPFTLGHEKVVETAKQDFENIIIAILVNKEKVPYFSLKDRLDFINTIYFNDERIKVTYYNGMLVDFLKLNNTVYTIRGIRNEIDLEYEKKMDEYNKSLMPEVESIMYKIDDYKEISSTLVRKNLINGDNIGDYVNAKITPKIIRILSNKDNI